MSLADRFRLLWTPFLKQKGGRTFQAVGLVCPKSLGSGGTFTLQIGSDRLEACPIDLLRYPFELVPDPDPPIYLWLIPRPRTKTRVRCTWRTSMAKTFRDTIQLSPASPRQVHIVFKTHVDLGYTEPLDDVISKYQGPMLEKLLANLDETSKRPAKQRFTWTLPWWILEKSLEGKSLSQDKRQRLESYIRKGQVNWGLAPFTTHSEFFGLEEMCRSMYGARRLALRFDRPIPTAVKMTDVPSHTSSLAMAFASAGGRFFQIGTNPDSRPAEVPPLFWWQMPDGERVLCHYCATYGTDLIPPEHWPWKHWLSLQMTGDNIGPPDTRIFKGIDWLNEHFDEPTFKMGQLEDFANAVVRDHGKTLPEIDDEFTDWWIHGIASFTGPTALARRAKEMLPAAETLLTLSSAGEGKADQKQTTDQLRQAYENLALYTEHTWGDHATDGDNALGQGNRYTSSAFASNNPKPPVDRWVSAWERKADFALQAYDVAEKLESKAADQFVRNIKPRGQDHSIMLLNPLGWERGGVVRMSDNGWPGNDYELVDPRTGQVVTYERSQGVVEFVAPPVPACGYLCLELRPVSVRNKGGMEAEWAGRDLTLHSGEYTMRFHKKGGLARWYDRARSAQWCATEVDWPLGSYVYEMPGGDRIREFAKQVHTQQWQSVTSFFHRRDYEGMPDFGPVAGDKMKVTPEITGTFARVVVEGKCPAGKPAKRRSGNARRVRTTFTHYHGQRELHVNMQVIGKRATYAAEAGYAFFPFAGENPWIAVDRISHLCDPAEELADGVNAAQMAVHRGLRVEGSYAGMNFVPVQTPLMGFEQPNAYRFDDDGDYETGLIYANLFNNCWGTNFPQWQSGDFSFDFVCQPTGNDDWDGGLSRLGAEVHRPLTARLLSGRPEEPAGTLLEVDAKYAQLVTVKPADFEPGMVIRLWNADVDPARVNLRFHVPLASKELVPCDLLERPTKRAISINNAGQAKVTLKPHQVATFLIRDKATGK